MSSERSASSAAAAAIPRLLLVMGPAGCGKSSVGQALVDALNQHYAAPASQSIASHDAAAASSASSFVFVEADLYHSAANKAKMASGVGLTDSDRAGWLEDLSRHTVGLLDSGSSPVLACSALKRAYRRVLLGKEATLQEAIEHENAEEQTALDSPVGASTAAASSPSSAAPERNVVVFLSCSRELLQRRLDARAGHFAKGSLIDSQLATLQPPTDDECARIGARLITVDCDDVERQKISAEDVAKRIAQQLVGDSSR